VVLILIAAGWLAALFVALMMCRLAARSDDSDAAALYELMTISRVTQQRAAPADAQSGQIPPDPSRVFRATG
jgi:hypothetical protein